MNSKDDRKETWLAYVIVSFSICCYFYALKFDDIPSYESDYLHGITWLLHWGLLAYLPVFPLVSGLIAICISPPKTSYISCIRGVIIMNCVLTVVFTIFAYSSGILLYSWLFMTGFSAVPLLGVIYEKRKKLNDGVND